MTFPCLLFRATRLVVALVVWAALVALVWSAISNPRQPAPLRPATQSATAPTRR